MGKYLGQSLLKEDGIGQVTGAAKYLDDLRVPGMHHIKVLHSPSHKGIIRTLDLSAVEKVPGVIGTLTCKDIPGEDAYGFFIDQPVFASETVCFKGERIAAVVAIDEDTAQEGIEKIKLDIEEQEPVFDVLEAIKPDAPLVRPDLESNLWANFNTGGTVKFLRVGDITRAFEEADEIVEGHYTNATNDHAALEPHMSVAYFDDADRLCIHTDSQCLQLHLITGLLGILNLPMSKIRYVGGRIGGGFGGKNDVHTDHVAGLAALKFRVPVKYRMSRREDLLYTTKRGGWIFKIRDGVKRNGKIIAREFKMWHDCGAYAGMGPYAVEKLSVFGLGPYFVPNIDVEGWSVFTNKPVASSQRGFAVTNGHSAIEIQMNRNAEAIGMSPWEIRLINAWREGDVGSTQYPVPAPGVVEVIQKVAELAEIDLPDHLKAMDSKRRTEI
jgi:CO/xanthine dehydrogenase Mo-binding subunit